MICVECGTACADSCAYRTFRGGAIRLLRCAKCGANVDKYVEYDFVMLLLDVLLHKVQAFRHLLSNRRINSSSHLKFWAVSILCTAYVKYIPLKMQQKPSVLVKFIFSNGMPEFDFCLAICFTILEILTFVVTIILIGKTLQRNRHVSFSWVSWFLLSGYGRLLAIPVALWAKETSVLYWLPTMLTFTSTLQTIRVSFTVTFLQAALVTLAAISSEHVVQWTVQKKVLYS
ncbi:protein ARV1-like [Oscarella lobularis]|uniref:protein ARV1-like n=1 Tax=Oscarella lobularis TaxID=121494 RepID=UPI0033142F80